MTPKNFGRQERNFSIDRKYTVEDKYATANNVDRTHDLFILQDGKEVLKSFTFKPGERKPFPQDRAIKMLRAECFIVRNSRNHQIMLRGEAGDNPGERTVVVQPHELVVPVTAVLKDYLAQIAATLPEWEKVLGRDMGSWSREDLEEFVISKSMADAGAITVIDQTV